MRNYSSRGYKNATQTITSSPKSGAGETSSSGRSWLLDPLDGTANFSRANPMFCCCVSVAENDRITHAAVAAPRLGDLYHARLGGGAYRDSGGQSQRLTVSATEQLEYAFTGADVGFIRQGNKPESAGLLEVFARSWQLRALGSAGIRGGLARRRLHRRLGRHPQYGLGLRAYGPTGLRGRRHRYRPLRRDLELRIQRHDSQQRPRARRGTPDSGQDPGREPPYLTLIVAGSIRGISARSRTRRPRTRRAGSRRLGTRR